MRVEIITEFANNLPNQISTDLSSDHLSSQAISSIASAISMAGYECNIWGGIPDLINAYTNKTAVDKAALYLNISNGMTQPSRRMQAPILCELLGVNYTGSTPTTVALMNNKYFTKRVVRDLVKVPKDILIDNIHEINEKINEGLVYPVIIKPNGEGGSYGIYQENVVYNKVDAITKTQKIMEEYPEVLLEELIPGTEITNIIIGNKNNYLLNNIIVYKTYGKFEHRDLIRDIKIKTQDISEMYPISAYTNDSAFINMIKNTSIAIFEKLGCRDIARIDYKINPNGELIFLEINSNPNLYAKYINVICEENQIKYPEFLSLILKSAHIRYGL